MTKVCKVDWLKFSFSKKATQFETIFHLIWRLLRRPVVPGGGGAWHDPQILADILIPSQQGGADYAHHIIIGTPRLSDLLKTLPSKFHVNGKIVSNFCCLLRTSEFTNENVSVSFFFHLKRFSGHFQINIRFSNPEGQIDGLVCNILFT